MSVSGVTIGTGGYATALSILSNKDEYDFNEAMNGMGIYAETYK